MRFKILLPFLGLILFIYILYSVGLQNIITSFYQFNLFYFILGLVSSIPIILLKVYKWKILTPQSKSYSFYNAICAWLLSFTIGIITPGKLGEFYRAVSLEKCQIGRAHV